MVSSDPRKSSLTDVNTNGVERITPDAPLVPDRAESMSAAGSEPVTLAADEAEAAD